MPKHAPDATLDAAFLHIAGSSHMHAISSYSVGASYAAVVAASLADVAMADVDFTRADGDTSGRKVTVAAKAGVPIDATGTATHVALVKASDNTVRYVTTCGSLLLTSGGLVNFPAWEVEVADPT